MLKAENIHKSFGNLQVLKGIDFSVNAGEIVSIVGASGAGKSTLLQILGSLSVPDQGKVIIDNTDVFKLSSDKLSNFRNKKIGFVFQFHHLLPEFDALENVMIPALIAKENTADVKKKAIDILTKIGLGERIHHNPSELSGGEQQRVAIARAIINNPSILFADEPSGNLDSKTKENIHRLFFKLRDMLGITIIIVTHDKDLAKMCDRMMQMKDGLFI
ncbi:MAG: ABC transporter ATP-binding protein [Bacteroidales bacterium]